MVVPCSDSDGPQPRGAGERHERGLLLAVRAAQGRGQLARAWRTAQQWQAPAAVRSSAQRAPGPSAWRAISRSRADAHAGECRPQAQPSLPPPPHATQGQAAAASPALLGVRSSHCGGPSRCGRLGRGSSGGAGWARRRRHRRLLAPHPPRTAAAPPHGGSRQGAAVLLAWRAQLSVALQPGCCLRCRGGTRACCRCNVPGPLTRAHARPQVNGSCPWTRYGRLRTIRWRPCTRQCPGQGRSAVCVAWGELCAGRCAQAAVTDWQPLLATGLAWHARWLSARQQWLWQRQQ
jgi:hypothetical protein